MAFSSGSHNAICDRCGFKYKSHQLVKEWTGLRVCRGGGTNDCWEPRHPQDFVRGRKDQQAPPWTRPDPPEVVRSEHQNAELIQGDVLASAAVEEELALQGDLAVTWATFVVDLKGDAK